MDQLNSSSEIHTSGYLYPQRIGLSDHDSQNIINSDDLEFTVVNQSEVAGNVIPALIPVDKIFWYNDKFLQDTYGVGRDVLYIPPLSAQDFSLDLKDEVGRMVSRAFDNGAVLVVDAYRDRPDDRIAPIIEILGDDNRNIIVENLGGGEQERYLNQYIARVDYEGEGSDYKYSPSTYDVYVDMVGSGELPHNESDGPSLMDEIVGEEADELWNLYKEPFLSLSKEHPVNAGYDEESFKALLRDPSVIKVINRAGGDITTLSMFLTDMDQCPWLDKEYFTRYHNKAFDTDNILIFLGIVTDENKRGHAYASDVVDLLAKVTSNRGSSVLVTFECNEISEQVTPSLVKAAIENSGLAKVSGLDRPVSQLSFFALRKAS